MKGTKNGKPLNTQCWAEGGQAWRYTVYCRRVVGGGGYCNGRGGGVLQKPMTEFGWGRVYMGGVPPSIKYINI